MTVDENTKYSHRFTVLNTMVQRNIPKPRNKLSAVIATATTAAPSAQRIRGKREDPMATLIVIVEELKYW